MTYSVDWTPQSLHDMKRLDKTIMRRIVDGVNRLAAENYGDVKILTNSLITDTAYRIAKCAEAVFILLHSMRWNSR